MNSDDQELRRVYRDNSARVDLCLFKSELAERLPSSHGRQRGKSVRYALLTVAIVALLAGTGLGVSTLIDRLSRPADLLVITDTPGPAQSSTTGSASTSSTLPAIDTHGLWAGNVRTVPEKPVSLPAEFYEEPAHPAQLSTGEQLWVFADELTTKEVAAAVKSAFEEQTILIFDPSEELCEALDIPKHMRPNFVGELPAIFTQSPVLYREQVFAEVGPHWNLLWMQLDGELGEPGYKPDPEAVYAAAASWTLRLEEQREGLEANQEAQTGETTPTTDLYPIQRTVESEQAQALARDALEYLETVTGQPLEIEDAAEQQMVGPNDVVEHRDHGAGLVEPTTGRRLRFSVSWSDENQMGGLADDGMSGSPTAWFDAADGSRGYIAAAHGYYCRLQLHNGVTALAETTAALSLGPPAELSFLTAQQLIAFTEWLAERGEYLRP